MQPGEQKPDPWQPWREARHFDDLCARAADFLWGELPAFPGWMAPDIDEETDPLVPYLDRACQAGFLPTASQPAACPHKAHDGQPQRRRAFVIGFASADFLQGLTQRTRGKGLWLHAYPGPQAHDPVAAYPVAERGGTAYLFVGDDQRSAELEIFAQALSPSALEALTACHYVCLCDPDWGRDDLLWPILAATGHPER